MIRVSMGHVYIDKIEIDIEIEIEIDIEINIEIEIYRNI